MPPRDGLYSQSERRFRDALITFENGNRIEILPTSISTQEVTFTLEGTCLNHMQDIIEEYAAKRRREAEYQALNAAFERSRTGAADGMDALAYAFRAFSEHSTSFMDALNDVWESLGDDFELADEEEYVVTDPISFDELMGGCSGDN